MSKPKNYPSSPTHIWERFYQLTRVPRPSKKEEKVKAYLVEQAKERGCKYKIDEVGNVVIYLPASAGYESHQTVIIQNHMDMVCDKLPERKIDFENDPIDIDVVNGHIIAVGTTLGADNGIGCATALALMDDLSVKHPPLELLFTVDEETGLGGALNVDPKLLSGKKMINMDTEEWGAFYIGCAGGEDYKIFGDFDTSSTASMMKDFATLKVSLGGLKGGHSGIDIHRNRGNAIKILASLLSDLSAKHQFFLADFVGGQAHNIIPRDAHAVICIKKELANTVLPTLLPRLAEIKGYLSKEDKDATIVVANESERKSVLTIESRDRFLSCITMLPHGAYSYNWDSAEPLVNISCNLAITKMVAGEFYAQLSGRFFDKHQLREISDRVKSCAKMCNLRLEVGLGYPSWKPEFSGNGLLELSKTVYKEMFGHDAKVKAIHAGLECGVLTDRLGKMDMISLGPNLYSVHSPSERLEIASTNDFWKLIVGILEKL